MLLKEYAEFYDNLIGLSKRFVEKYCIIRGSLEKARNMEMDVHFLNDYRFFAFTKCTKSLVAYRLLLESGYYEDALVLARTMLECYMSQRYFDENFDIQIQNNMVNIPMKLFSGLLYFNGNMLLDPENGLESPYERTDPGDMPKGKDRSYFTFLYSFLCTHAHCNFATLKAYLDESSHFVLHSEWLCELAHVCGLFIFAKMYEHVALLENIHFSTIEEEKEYSDTLIDLTAFLYCKLDGLNESYKFEGILKNVANKLFTSMKKSFKEQLGRVDKSFLKDLERKNIETRLEIKMKPILMTSEKPSNFFEKLISNPVMKCHYRELFYLIDTGKWEHTMQSLDKAVLYRENVNDSYAFMLSVLSYDMQDPKSFLDKATNNFFVKRYVNQMRQSVSLSDWTYMKMCL